MYLCHLNNLKKHAQCIFFTRSSPVSEKKKKNQKSILLSTWRRWGWVLSFFDKLSYFLLSSTSYIFKIKSPGTQYEDFGRFWTSYYENNGNNNMSNTLKGIKTRSWFMGVFYAQFTHGYILCEYIFTYCLYTFGTHFLFFFFMFV